MYRDLGHLGFMDEGFVLSKSSETLMKTEPSETLYESGDERVTAEIGFVIAKEAVKNFREILSGLDYSIISSTALYLRDLEEGKKTNKPPGDFDAVVFSEVALKSAVDRLANVGAIFLERDKETVVKNGNPIRIMPDHQAKVVSGYFPIEVKGETIKYEFELFFETQIAPKDKIRRLVQDNILTREGLQLQYGENLRMETRIRKAVDEVTAFLIQEKNNLEDPNQEINLQQVLASLDLRPEDLRRFYFLHKEMSEAKTSSGRKDYQNQIEDLLTGGFKTKVPERLAKLEKLRTDMALIIEPDLKEDEDVIMIQKKPIDVDDLPISADAESAPRTPPKFPHSKDLSTGAAA